MIVNHDDFASTRMCLSGRRPGSSSSTPACTSTHREPEFGSGTGEPHRLQNDVRYGGGLSRRGASYFRIRFSPWRRRKSSRSATTQGTKAEPLALRHRLQWHSSNGSVARAISNRTPPQRQLPRIMMRLRSVATCASSMRSHSPSTELSRLARRPFRAAEHAVSGVTVPRPPCSGQFARIDSGPRFRVCLL